MALKVMEKDTAATDDIPILVVTSTDIVSNIKGYHVYKLCGHQLYKNRCMEKLSHITLSINMLSALKRMKKWLDIYHLGENRKFAKTIFYFLLADPYGKCNITVAGKAANLGDGDGMQVPRILHLSGQKSMVEILKQQKIT